MTINRFFAYNPSDPEEIRLEKFATFLAAGSCTLAGMAWTALYFFTFGWGLTAYLPASFVIIVGTALVISHLSKNHYYAIYAQIVCIIYITAFIQWSIGGVFDSGFVLVWAFLGPLCSLMFFPLKQSVFWFLLYLSNLVITVVFNDYFVTHGQEAAPTIRLVFFILNLSIASIVVFIFAGYYVIAAKREREKANTLLLNVLPKEIAPVLKSNNGHTIADSYPSASVLFADMIGSTPLFETMKPTAAVDWLNEVFSMFDKLVDRYGLENIRTIGDNYMVASGVPTHRKDHAHTLAKLALEMVDGINQIPARNGHQMQFRLGINSGPLVAGVIGKTKFHYDVWGDVVNTAARMESHGQAGKFQIGPGTYELINDEFRCIPRGEVKRQNLENSYPRCTPGRRPAYGAVGGALP